jgi:hypothetical protein
MATLTQSSLKAQIGFYLGWKDPAAWTATQIAELNTVIARGLRQFYTPPVLPNEAAIHQWSFLRPIATLATVADQDTYDLPANFGALIGQMHFSAADDQWTPIQIVNVGRIEAMRTRDLSNGAPVCAAVTPKVPGAEEDAEGEADQRFSLIVQPAPDAIYTIRYRYQIVPVSLDDSTVVYPLGGECHAETILQSCLAIAELMYNDLPGPQNELWMQRLRASIAFDRKQAPETLGYNRDNSDCPDMPVPRRFVTYGGQLYDGT